MKTKKNNIKKKINIKQEYSKTINSLKSSKKYILISLIIFTTTTLIGFVFPVFFKEKIMEMILEMSTLMDGKNTFQIILTIFLNNTKVSIISILFGVVFGIVPLLIGTINGYILGFVARKVTDNSGAFVLWQLLPHGIFEIPAIIISIGLGIQIGLRPKSKDDLKETAKESLRIFLIIILPLLIIAAIVEGILIAILQ